MFNHTLQFQKSIFLSLVLGKSEEIDALFFSEQIKREPYELWSTSHVLRGNHTLLIETDQAQCNSILDYIGPYT